MNLSLSPKAQKLIEKQVKSGRYHTPEDVVVAALAMLEQQERSADFAPGELDAILVEGEQDIERGDVLDAEQVFAELRRVSKERRRRTG